MGCHIFSIPPRNAVDWEYSQQEGPSGLQEIAEIYISDDEPSNDTSQVSLPSPAMPNLEVEPVKNKLFETEVPECLTSDSQYNQALFL